MNHDKHIFVYVVIVILQLNCYVLFYLPFKYYIEILLLFLFINFFSFILHLDLTIPSFLSFSPPFHPVSPLIPSIHSSFVSLQRVAGLPRVLTKHGISSWGRTKCLPPFVLKLGKTIQSEENISPSVRDRPWSSC